MRSWLASTLLLLASAAATPILSNRDTCSTNDLHIPSGGMKLKPNGVPFGFGPDEDDGGRMAPINALTKKKASTYLWYAQIHDAKWDGSQLTEIMSDLKSSGAAFIPSVMPEIPFSQITSAVATDIANVVKKFTSEGIEVWLRFGHEMNCYVSEGCSEEKPAPYSGSPTEFIQAWKNVHSAVADIEGCLMFWSPNLSSTAANMSAYWPGANYVDIVGVDHYIKDKTSTFASVYGSFYDTYAKGYNKHFVIGETGASVSDVALKEYWLGELAGADTKTYPCFQAATWFEYDKGVDFRLFVGQSASTQAQSLSHFE